MVKGTAMTLLGQYPFALVDAVPDDWSSVIQMNCVYR